MKIHKILLLSIALFVLNSLNAQTRSASFLYQVGTTDSLYSNLLKEQRKIYVQVPESFRVNSNQKYPVVYVLDGEIFLPTVCDIQNYYSGGYFPEMVIVGISNDKNRNRDLTPSVVAAMYGTPVTEANGGADIFSKFIQSELIPYIEKTYPVTNYRTLIGHSYGGLFTIYSLLNNPSTFENYLAIDPSLSWHNQFLLKQAIEALSANNYTGKSLYMSLSGQLHMQNPLITIDNIMEDDSDFTLFSRSNLAFRDLVKQQSKNGLFLEWEFFSKELHGTITFPSIKNGLISVFEWYQMEQTDKFNSPETSKEVLKSIIEYRANKLQDHFKYEVPPYPEDLLNALGYMSMDMEQMEKSKMFFNYLIKYYPNSSNANESMADYFERQENYVSAIEFVTKAYELSGEEYYQERRNKLKEKAGMNDNKD